MKLGDRVQWTAEFVTVGNGGHQTRRRETQRGRVVMIGKVGIGVEDEATGARTLRMPRDLMLLMEALAK